MCAQKVIKPNVHQILYHIGMSYSIPRHYAMFAYWFVFALLASYFTLFFSIFICLTTESTIQLLDTLAINKPCKYMYKYQPRTSVENVLVKRIAHTFFHFILSYFLLFFLALMLLNICVWSNFRNFIFGLLAYFCLVYFIFLAAN